jgi:hypothetical protein
MILVQCYADCEGEETRSAEPRGEFAAADCGFDETPTYRQLQFYVRGGVSKGATSFSRATSAPNIFNFPQKHHDLVRNDLLKATSATSDYCTLGGTKIAMDALP